MTKKLFIPVALAVTALAVSSCSDKESSDIAPVQDGAIRFAPRTAYTARSSDITTNNLSEFFVYAYTGSSDAYSLFMDKVTVTKTANNTWTYSPIKYWPANSPVSFFAYAPMGWISDSGPLEPSHYDNYGADKDLIYAVSLNNIGNVGSENAQVILNFRHALSKVTFNLSSSNEHLKVVVTNVAISTIQTQGSFNFPAASTTAGTTADATTVGTWTDLSTPYPVILYSSQRPDEAITLDTTPNDLSEGGFGGDKYFLPQPLTYRSNGAGNDNYLTVMCSIYDAETGVKVWPNAQTPEEDFLPGSTHEDGLLKFALNTTQFSEWQPGYHYIYNVIINSNPEMDAINFGTPTVDSYVEVETTYE